MKYLSLFSGIEAATQAWQPLGWECVAVSEIEPFPCALLENHYPHVPNLGDVTKITEQQIKDLGQIDLVVFGSPCQNLSVAGNRKGFDGEQSSLFYSAMEIIKYAKRHCGARFALWENVPGAFSSNKGADFTEVVKNMAGLSDLDTPTNGWGKEGAAVGDHGLLEWSVLDAQWFGLAQRRKRVFAIVDFGEWESRPPILLERQSLRGDSAPSREARQDVTSDVRECAAIKGFAKQRIGEYKDGEIVSTCAARDYKDATDLVIGFAEPSRARALDIFTDDSPVPTLMAAMGTGGNNMTMVCQEDAIAIAGNIIGRAPKNGGNHNGFDESGACYTLTASDRHAVAFQQNTRDEVRLMCGDGQIAGALAANLGMKQQNYIAAQGSSVRRLTPIECERLQGFPDNFTQIPYRNKSADDCPNGVRYKALGNSMAVNVMAWIGQRVQQATAIKVYGVKR